MRHLFMSMLLMVFMAGCATKPMDLHVPEDHPANPEAVSISPSRLAPDYRYTLPPEPDSLDEADHAATPHKDRPTASSHKPTEGMPHKDHPKMHEGSHDH